MSTTFDFHLMSEESQDPDYTVLVRIRVDDSSIAGIVSYRRDGRLGQFGIPQQIKNVIDNSSEQFIKNTIREIVNDYKKGCE